MQRRSANSLHLGLALFAALIVLIAPAVYADPPTRAARLAYVTGSVSLAPAGLPDEWGEAFVNRPLTIGDRLWADPGGRAELRLGSTALRIDGNTSLDILALDERVLQVSVEQGRAQVRTRGGAGGQAEIDTPAAAIVISSASDVRVDVDPASGRTSVLVRTGRASVHTPNDSFDLASGESTRIDADGRYYSIGRVGQRDAFDQFAYTRDSRWREPRYVSAEMTGYEDLVEHGAWQPTSEYGNVWFPRAVSTDWVPYRDGRWVWVEPWGWTWVDNAPWGFAPFHYGRWVQVGPRWGWWPGEAVARPVYAPALVAFFGGDNFGVSVSVGSAPAVGWFPLGYRDPYIPWYTTSPSYRRNLNVAYVRDPVVLNQIVNVNVTNVNVTTVNNFRYAHRERANVATVVPRTVFVAAQPVRAAAVAVPLQRVAGANVMVGAAPVAPERQSVIGRPSRAERAPRSDRIAKPVVAVNQPAAAPPRFEQRQAESTREQGKPFEVKPIAPRDDRRPDATRSAGTTPQGAPATTAVAPTNREVRVIRAKAPESREARDRGAQKDRDVQAQQAPQPGAAPGTPQTARTAPPSPQQAAQPQGDDRAGQQREAQQREAQQRETQQREAQQRGVQQREAQQRDTQQRETQQREAQQRDAQQRDAQQREAQQQQTQQREAQERQAQQREAQQREAQQSKAQQREAEERQAQQREAQQREAQQSKAAQQREAQERQAQQREAQQREAQQSKAQQREAQERQAQQREAQQREAQQGKAAQQREAQERQAQQREAQQREAQQSKAQQREAQERQAQQREAQQREAQQSKAQQREAQERQAQQREAQQREAQQSKAQREAQQRAAQQREEQKGAAPPPSTQGQGRGNEPQSRNRGAASEPQAESRGRNDREERGQPDRRG